MNKLYAGFARVNVTPMMTVGGCKISADWPGFVRRTVEKVLDNAKCIFFNGAQGDVNHVKVHPKEGDLNGMFMATGLRQSKIS